MDIHKTGIRVVAVAAALTGGCVFEYTPLEMPLFEDTAMTTQPRQLIQEDWVWGKWDTDARETVLANARPFIEEVLDEMGRPLKDQPEPEEPIDEATVTEEKLKAVPVESWWLASGGMFTRETPNGSESGHWRIEGKRVLVIQLPSEIKDRAYWVSFKEGCLHLRNQEDNQFLVFKKDRSLPLHERFERSGPPAEE